MVAFSPTSGNIQQRRDIVSALFSVGKSAGQITKSLAEMNIVNPRTNKPYSRTTVLHDLNRTPPPTANRPSSRIEFLNGRPAAQTQPPPASIGAQTINGIKTFRRPVAETIGQWTFVRPMYDARILLNLDLNWPDYVFWDALRRGTAAGYTISGPAFCLPAAQTIASYVFGRGFGATLLDQNTPQKPAQKRTTLHENGRPTQNKRNAVTKNPITELPKPKLLPGADNAMAWTNQQLRRMIERNQAFLLNVLVDNYCLGNQYVIVNPDCTFSIASPETVTVDYSASDYRKMLRVTIHTKMELAEVWDVYTADKRTITTRYYDQRGTFIEEYENLIGRIPIIHFHNDRSANEIYGRPIYQGGLPIMRLYDDLITNILEGVALLGQPIPTFTGLKNVTETKTNNSIASTYLDPMGNEQTEYITLFNRNAGLWLGEGGDAKMLNPPVGFTKDSLDALRQLFLLWLNETHIPELIWGGAISASKASTETQMPPFIQYINFRRLMFEGQGSDPALGIDASGGLLELIDVWLRMYKLLNPSIVVGPVQIEWPEIDVYGDQTKFLWASTMRGMGDISPHDMVSVSGLFADPPEVIRRAAGAKRATAFDAYSARLNKSRLDAAKHEDDPADDDGRPYSTDYNTYPYQNPQNGADYFPERDNQAPGMEQYGVNGPLWLPHPYGGTDSG